MVEIKGLEKFAGRDFPGRISSTVFLAGCPFRCPYCHNAELVLAPDSLPTLPLDFFLSYLDGRKGWLDGVCVSGGEPLLHEDLDMLLRVVKERDLQVKVDTNGAFPDRLERLLADGLVDRVAMDVKAPIERYREVARVHVDVEAILRSVDLLRAAAVPVTFRTTVVPGLVGREDLFAIAEWLRGAEDYRIQGFVPQSTLDPEYRSVQPFRREEVEEMAAALRPYYGMVRVEET